VGFWVVFEKDFFSPVGLGSSYFQLHVSFSKSFDVGKRNIFEEEITKDYSVVSFCSFEPYKFKAQKSSLISLIG